MLPIIQPYGNQTLVTYYTSTAEETKIQLGTQQVCGSDTLIENCTLKSKLHHVLVPANKTFLLKNQEFSTNIPHTPRKFMLISDVHANPMYYHDRLPQFDVALMAGDFSKTGTEREIVQSF